MASQIHRSALPGGQTEGRLLERRVRVTFGATTQALPRRPEPRSAFDNVFRRENPTRPWGDHGDMLRMVARDAAALGGPAVDQTRALLAQHVLAFSAWVLEGLDDGQPIGAWLYSQMMREVAESIEAGALAAGLGTTEAKARAHRETKEAITAQRLWCALLEADSVAHASLSAIR